MLAIMLAVEVAAPADFKRDTAVAALGGNRWGATIREEWSGPPGPNGGYVAALLLRAMRAAVDDAEREPRSLTVHYLRPPSNGPAEIVVDIERMGRSAATCTARLQQEGKDMCIAICVLAPDFEAFADFASDPPSVPPAETIEQLDASFLPPKLFEQLDMRLVFGGIPFSGSDVAEVGGWVRTRVPAPLEPELIALHTDAWWPAPFARAGEPFLAPTLDLTIHFRGKAPPGDHEFVLSRFTSSTADRGYFEEDGWVWAADGTLLAHSRQLALIRPWKREG